MRTGKTVNGTATKYYYLGTQLIDMTSGADKLHFIYNNIGVESVEFNGTNYYYVQNAQGDIIAIVGKQGNAHVLL